MSKHAGAEGAKTDGAAGHQPGAPKHAAAERGRKAAGGASAHPHRGRHAALALAIVAAVLVAAYGGASYYFSSHFLPRTTVNGIDASLMDEGQLKGALDDRIASFSTNVSNADGSFSLDVVGENVGIASDTAKAAADAAASFAGPAWPARIASPTDIEVDQSATYDQGQLDALVRAAVEDYDKDATQPQGSHVAYDEASGSFVASEATYGTALDADKVVAAAGAGVAALQGSVTLGDDALLAPAETQTSEQVVAAANAANGLIQAEIPLTLNGKEAARLTKDQLASWIKVDDAMNVTLDQDAAKAWVDQDLSPAVDYSDATYDWKVSTDKLVQRLSDAVQAGSADAIAIPMYSELKVPDETPGAAQLGRHIDVNLATQYARLYDDSGSVIWESYIVSGNKSQGRSTPCGTYAINNKMSDVTLVGADQNHDGQPDYRSKVKYWMPFIGNSVGLHDASWRSRFGGDIYEYNGSHGCVNLPSDKAAQLYGLIQVGDKVIVHE